MKENEQITNQILLPSWGTLDIDPVGMFPKDCRFFNGGLTTPSPLGARNNRKITSSVKNQNMKLTKIITQINKLPRANSPRYSRPTGLTSLFFRLFFIRGLIAPRYSSRFKNKIFILYPGGNITAIVKDKISRGLQSFVAQKIIQSYIQGKPINRQIEQVAFIEKPNNKKAVSRLRLAGGEFSGNATLCLAWLVLKKRKIGLLEVSGSKELLKAKRLRGFLKIQIPSPKSLSQLRKFTKEGFPVIFLEGICQVVVDKFYGKKELEQKKIGLNIIKNNKFTKEPAAGVLFIKKLANRIKMRPYIYFEKGTKWGLYTETACGSGSTAIAINEYFNQGKNIRNLKVTQPTGCSLFTTVRKTNNHLEAWIKGKVKLIYQGSLSLA